MMLRWSHALAAEFLFLTKTDFLSNNSQLHFSFICQFHNSICDSMKSQGPRKSVSRIRIGQDSLVTVQKN